MIRCDGCDIVYEGSDLAFVSDLGHTVRYCRECQAEWGRFEKAQQAEALRLQRLLTIWQQRAREALRLNLTVLDFPPVNRTTGNLLVLS